MEFHITLTAPQKQKADCLVLPVFKGGKLSPTGHALNQHCDALTHVLKQGVLGDELGQCLLLPSVSGITAPRILLVRAGDGKSLTEFQYRKTLSQAITFLLPLSLKHIAHYLTEIPVQDREDPWKLRQAIAVYSQHAYTFTSLKSEKSKPRLLTAITFHAASKTALHAGEKAVREGSAIADGIAFTKNIGNLPANICTPAYLAQQATQLAKSYSKISTRILEKSEVQKLGMNAFLAVAKGSHEPPKLITVHYQGASKTTPPVALVGKGITFDTGGISMKPAQGMEEMKLDKCGAAAILGAIKAAAELSLPVNIVAVIAATENMPGGGATKPGDVVTSLSGQTVEIVNTDAEGRLILCDALTYVRRFKPTVVIDVATLTMGIIIALGGVLSGLMTHDDDLARALEIAGNESGDPLWRMPLRDEYHELLKSNTADVANINWSTEARAIVAATFLSRFTKDMKWAHLDVAGTAWKMGKDGGCTGRPVALLVEYLKNLSLR